MSNNRNKVNVNAIFEDLEKHLETITSSDEEELISKEFTKNEIITLCMKFKCRVALYKGNVWIRYERKQENKYKRKNKEITEKAKEKIHEHILSKGPQLYRSYIGYENRHNKNKPKRLRYRRFDYREYLDLLENNNDSESEASICSELDGTVLFTPPSVPTNVNLREITSQDEANVSSTQRDIELPNEDLENPDYGDLVYNIRDGEITSTCSDGVEEFLHNAVEDYLQRSEEASPIPEVISQPTYTDFAEKFSRSSEIHITSTQDKQIAYVRPNYN